LAVDVATAVENLPQKNERYGEVAEILRKQVEMGN